MALPFVEMLLEGISELMALEKDPEAVLLELQEEEDKEYEAFFEVPVKETFDGEKKTVSTLFEGLGDEIDYWFKGPSICRQSLLPSMSRYLGLATNSDNVGGSARCGEETYDLGFAFDRSRGVYTFTGNRSIPPGEFGIMSPNDFRHCDADCPEIVMPDYKDWFMGNWSEGSASITFPNEKEREYFGYAKGKYKGIIGLVPTVGICE